MAGANFASWEWQEDGLCRQRDGSLFVGPDLEQASARRRREHRAKLVCNACPVLLQCRRHALEVREAHGVWGGLSTQDRERILRNAANVN